MLMEIKQRLLRLGVDPNKDSLSIIEDLTNVVEYLYKELEQDEQDRFRKEIQRIKRPTN